MARVPAMRRHARYWPTRSVDVTLRDEAGARDVISVEQRDRRVSRLTERRASLGHRLRN